MTYTDGICKIIKELDDACVIFNLYKTNDGSFDFEIQEYHLRKSNKEWETIRNVIKEEPECSDVVLLKFKIEREDVE